MTAQPDREPPEDEYHCSICGSDRMEACTCFDEPEDLPPPDLDEGER